MTEADAAARAQVAHAVQAIPTGLRTLTLLLEQIERAGSADPKPDVSDCAYVAELADWVLHQVMDEVQRLADEARAAGWV